MVVDAGRAVGSTLWFIGVFAVAALFAALFPGFSTQAATLIGRDPWTSLGIGLAVLVCVPFMALVLLITIIGIPLALLLVPIYLLLLFLGWVTAALFLAQKGLELARPGRPVTTPVRLLALLAALVAAVVPATGSVCRPADRAGCVVRRHWRAGLAALGPARATRDRHGVICR